MWGRGLDLAPPRLSMMTVGPPAEGFCLPVAGSDILLLPALGAPGGVRLKLTRPRGGSLPRLESQEREGSGEQGGCCPLPRDVLAGTPRADLGATRPFLGPQSGPAGRLGSTSRELAGRAAGLSSAQRPGLCLWTSVTSRPPRSAPSHPTFRPRNSQPSRPVPMRSPALRLGVPAPHSRESAPPESFLGPPLCSLSKASRPPALLFWGRCWANRI